MARTVLEGRIVTMGGQGVLEDGCVYLDGSLIRHVRPAGSPVPAGFEGVPRVVLKDCDVLPGLLDLHNHPPYNAFALWQVPRRFQGRSGWLMDPDYIRRVREPSRKLRRKSPPVHLALARYVEVRALMGGATSLQGLSAASDAAVYQGLVRNVEHPLSGSELPGANVQVMDLRPGDLGKFREQLKQPRPLFFHLSEGTDADALAQMSLVRNQALLRSNLVCIHCLGLNAADYEALNIARSHVVWSPLSNLLLYGQTLDIQSLASSKRPFALACDWTPSGSLNLLQELKVASLVDQQQPAGQRLGAARLARAVTVDAAEIAQSAGRLGVLADGHLADVLVLRRRSNDAYENLIAATERDVQAVYVDGEALYGDAMLMRQLLGPGAPLETLPVGGTQKALSMPKGPSLENCIALLKAHLDDLAAPGPAAPLGVAGLDGAAASFRLRFDMDDGKLTPHELAFDGPLNSVPMAPLTVVDDPTLCNAISAIAHVPDYLKGTALSSFYTS